MPRRDPDDYVVHPESILARCLHNGLITASERFNKRFIDAAQDAADRLRDEFPEGEGFGSSDFTALADEFLHNAGEKTAYVGGRLTRLVEKVG